MLSNQLFFRFYCDTQHVYFSSPSARSTKIYLIVILQLIFRFAAFMVWVLLAEWQVKILARDFEHHVVLHYFKSKFHKRGFLTISSNCSYAFVFCNAVAHDYEAYLATVSSNLFTYLLSKKSPPFPVKVFKTVNLLTLHMSFSRLWYSQQHLFKPSCLYFMIFPIFNPFRG